MKKRQRAIIFVLIAIIIALLFTIWKIRTPKKIIEKDYNTKKESIIKPTNCGFYYLSNFLLVA
jgi:Na+-translocating ferredoxin:NAD+ oxidoreductase RnfG subunit